ncbi:AlwI family type II restriction endonuclease [Flavobacterium columnare]|uniref:AlwI family type II restriction endonuclease n=1 Tax=Flavobacterium TaxID=237 RepID=UPI0018969CE1|nr:AlwI family type II restriction endonuclease [Flavobacterium columnare]MBF6652940.1 AlwI family type II restriction endonuclease [Flavobacterium columnare]MBF6657554.1 AlwI family type II restriction endonuclease [Flavobacterium columnare]
MARIDSKVIFVTTSPRTPNKMIPEIELLSAHFTGKKWNTETQREFMELLKEENFFNGEGANDPAFSARDRINRAPKALGFVTLSPTIHLTSAGLELVNSRRKDEIFLRQLLKFQVPSPYHKPSKSSADFWVKPYLELFRLIRYFGSLKFDELMFFGLQLVDYRAFEKIVYKINDFRNAKAQNEGNYRKFRALYLEKELEEIYADDIISGNTKTRETNDASITKFIKTKASNMRDYADACIRYLRATGLVNISHIGKSISIVPEKIQEVDYFLEHTDREPVFINNESQYIEYLGNANTPTLLTDNKELLEQKINEEFPTIVISQTATLQQLKDIFADELERRKEQIITEQITAIKDYRLFEDINSTFEQILDNSLYDTPLMLEWNTWRAMTMLDGGNIKANLKFDDFGSPMSTAQGNMADIVCDYDSFGLTVEVTMQSGQRQYETEGEPVTRHLAKVKRETTKPAYCLFIAPNINEACIAHFYALHKMNISYYGGTSTIVPLPLSIFIKMVEDSHKASYVPEPTHVQRFFERSNEIANTTDNEMDWYSGITNEALNWLND